MLHHAAGETYQLSELLKIPDRVSEQIWSVMKYILSSETNLLINRHLSQLVLCTVYGVCKVLNHPLKFQDITTRYQELLTFNKTDLTEIIYNVYINDNERGDLVRFYNAVYISHMKSHLFSSFGDKTVEMKSQTPYAKKPIISALTLSSPLKESLPQAMTNLSLANKRKSPMSKHSMTPMTSALYAYPESSGIGDPQQAEPASKRLINFEEVPYNSNSDAQPKMPKFLERIVEHKHEDGEDSSKKRNFLLVLYDSLRLSDLEEEPLRQLTAKRD